MVVNEIQAETGVGGSTPAPSREAENDELVTAEREKAFIRYRANTAALEQLLDSSSVLHPEQSRRLKKITAHCR
jgi:hypothetical protein